MAAKSPDASQYPILHGPGPVHLPLDVAAAAAASSAAVLARNSFNCHVPLSDCAPPVWWRAGRARVVTGGR